MGDPNLPTKSQIRTAIHESKPPSYALDQLVVLCFMPFYSIPPPFSTDEESAALLVQHFQMSMGRRVQIESIEGGRWRAITEGADGSPVRCVGSTRAHAITNVALWFAGCYMCVNDEG